jgi:hypothetical protein
VEGKEILNELSDHQLLKEYCAAWRQSEGLPHRTDLLSLWQPETENKGSGRGGRVRML